MLSDSDGRVHHRRRRRLHPAGERGAVRNTSSQNGLQPRHGRQYARSCRPYARRELRQGAATAIPFAIDGRDAFLIESAPDARSDLRLQSGFRAGRSTSTCRDRKEVRFGDTDDARSSRLRAIPRAISACYNRDEKLLITGDTLFRESIGRHRPSGRRLQLDHA